jgi:hypothetical protein
MFIARQRLGKQVPAEMNTHVSMQRRGKRVSITTDKLLGKSVFCWIRPEAMYVCMYV